MSKQRGRMGRGGSHARLHAPVQWLAEALERRLLLSAYTYSQIASVAPSAFVLDAGGNLYGVTSTGGMYGDGSVVEIAKGSNDLVATLASFDGTDGKYPTNVTLDRFGNLWGTTSQGGFYGHGTVFEFGKVSDYIAAIASFDGINNVNPEGNVALDSEGDLFGVTAGGGSNGVGTLYEIANTSTTITTLASFSGGNGSYPEGGVIFSRSGNLYGTTAAGGAGNSGTLFEVAGGSGAITTLGSFNSSTTGDGPAAALSLDASGNLYGTTEGGGSGGEGTVFELPAGSPTIIALAPFSVAPAAGVTLDAAGNLFSTTQFGGASSKGAVIEVAKGSSAMTTIYSFSGSDGAYPATGLALDPAGNLFGTTSGGGLDSSGKVFELSPNTTTSVTLAGGTNPSNAARSLVFTTTIQPTSPTGTVPNGETVILEDTSNNYAVVATGTLNNDSATLTVAVGTLLAGTHNLIAVYVGDANFGASQSAPYLQNVQLVVLNLKVNGNIASLAGVQRSMVDSILYTFSEPVEVSGNAATLAIEAGQIGTLPTSLTWTAIAPHADGSSNQWAVTFSGNGVVGNSIANGVYNMTLNSADVAAAANSTIAVQPRATDTFYRLFGDINGDGVVNAADNFRLKAALSVYNAAFDYNDGGVVNAADNFQFKADQSISFAGVGTTI